MKKVNKSKVIIPALAMIALTTAASATGTVAWFSVNRLAQVSGMQVKTQVSSSLYIAGDDTFAPSAAKADTDFKAGVLVQEIKAILEPASTVNGLSYYYTVSANENGSVKNLISGDKYTAYNADATATDTAHYANKFSEDYNITKTNTLFSSPAVDHAVPYVDYVFQLKLNNVEPESNLDLKLTKLDLTYTKLASETTSEKAFRVATFIKELTDTNNNSQVGEGDTFAAFDAVTTIYAPTDAQNQSYTNETPTNNAVNSESSTAAVSYNKLGENAVNKITTVTPGAHYYKMGVRLWIEGEDKTCTSTTFAALKGNWALVLDIQLGGATANVQSLNVVGEGTPAQP